MVVCYLYPAVTSLSYKLKHLRDARKLTQEDLARRARIGRTTVVGAERGGMISLECVRKLREALELTDDEWGSLLVAWISATLGPADFARLNISAGHHIVSGADTPHARLVAWVQTLSLPDCELLLTAKTHPAFMELTRAAIAALPAT